MAVARVEPPAPPAPRALAPEPAPRPRAPEPPSAADLPDRPPQGAPGIRLALLVYSRDPARRTVAVTIDNGAMTTVHEGEQVGGFEVGRIYPDHVEMHYGGTVFSLRGRD
jgi:hypothetical protein